MTKKKLEKTKRKKRISKKEATSSSRGQSAPENFFFGLILSSALLFSYICLMSAHQIQTSFPMAKISSQNELFERKMKKLVQGYPIEKMSPYISQRNKSSASFLVAIAKKESNWGRHAPKKDGRECFNYWGYRGEENPTSSGYSCFDSPEQAVNVVGKRLDDLIAENIDTPQKMVIWKCGTASCARRDRGAAKWVWDVGYYYNKLHSPEIDKSEKRKQTALRQKVSL